MESHAAHARPGKTIMRVGARHLWLCALSGLVLMTGCRTGQTKAISSVLGRTAGAVVGHQYGEAGIGQSIGSQAGAAVGQAAEAAASRHTLQPGPAQAGGESRPTKFCPIGGERYPEPYRYCPLHGAALRDETDQ